MNSNNKFSTIFQNNSKKIVFIIFILIFIVGLFVFKDFGVSIDDSHNRDFGISTYNFMLSFINRQNYNCTDQLCYNSEHGQIHSPLFEIVLIFAEKSLRLTDTRDIFLMRHFLTFILFYIGLIFFYLLCKKYFKNWEISLLGVIFIFLSPRIFADSFYNSVDINALAAFIIAIYSMFYFLERKTIKSALIHGIVCAIAIDMRITAIIAVLITFIFLTRDFFIADRTKKIFLLKLSFIFTITLIIFIILFWPYLWENPLRFFFSLLKSTSFKINIDNIYFSQIISSNNIPWHYNIIWIIITTPILYLILFFIGLIFIMLKFIKSKKFFNKTFEITLIIWFFLPLILSILFKTSLYNGWRHHYFIYPALIIISLLGLSSIYNKLKYIRNLQTIFFIVIFVWIVYISLIMSYMHPFEYVYFNEITPTLNNSCNIFEKDYWGISSKQAFEYLLRNNTNKKIYISFNSEGIYNNIMFLPKKERDRIVYVNKIDAQFYFSHHTPSDCRSDNLSEAYYKIYVKNMPIISIYKLK